MKRDPNLIRLSRDHHRGLVMCLRITTELATAKDEAMEALYSDFIDFWEDGLLPHCRTECECLLARLVRCVESGDELVRKTQRHHLDINALVMTMRDNDGVQERREALRKLSVTLREHIRWEEQVLFEATQRYLQVEEMKALGEDVAERIPEMPRSTWPTKSDNLVFE